MKEWPGGSHIFMKSNPRFTDDRPLMAIGYKYRSQKVLGFISMERGGSTEPGVPYLSCCPANYSSNSIYPVLCHIVIGRYFSACNATDYHNRKNNRANRNTRIIGRAKI